MNQKEYAEKLANDHWDYIDGLLTVHNEKQEIIEMIKYHYISAGVHFFGHGVEWGEKEYRRRKKKDIKQRIQKMNEWKT